LSVEVISAIDVTLIISRRKVRGNMTKTENCMHQLVEQKQSNKIRFQELAEMHKVGDLFKFNIMYKCSKCGEVVYELKKVRRIK
jgi:sulfur relay (sulfurtransferase) DsrF/TusC family protein